jgi:hypothetical protein
MQMEARVVIISAKQHWLVSAGIKVCTDKTLCGTQSQATYVHITVSTPSCPLIARSPPSGDRWGQYCLFVNPSLAKFITPAAYSCITPCQLTAAAAAAVQTAGGLGHDKPFEQAVEQAGCLGHDKALKTWLRF